MRIEPPKTNTKEYTEDKNGNVKRQQNKGDVVFEVETVVGSWLIQKGGAKAKTPKERVQQRASGSRAERKALVCGTNKHTRANTQTHVHHTHTHTQTHIHYEVK